MSLTIVLDAMAGMEVFKLFRNKAGPEKRFDQPRRAATRLTALGTMPLVGPLFGRRLRRK